MSTTKPSPETLPIAPAKPRPAASSLMRFSNPLPECPSRLPDGTILDYSAVDETWTDVTGFKSKGELEESIFKNHQMMKTPQVTPGHLLKHVTRVQSLAALVPVKEESAEPVKVVKFDKPEDEPAKDDKPAKGDGKLEMKKWMYKKDPTAMGERLTHWSVKRSGDARPKSSWHAKAK